MDDSSSPIAPYLVRYNPKGDRIKMAKVPPEGSLLDTPCILNMGALQLNDRSAARKEAERAAKTFFRITGTTGENESFRSYSVIYNISREEAKLMARRNSNITTYDNTPMPGTKKSEEFARKYIIGDANPPPSEDALEWWSKRFSRLIINGFSMGSMIGCEVLNRCNVLLQEKGFSRKQAEQILSHTKFISAADVSDVSFFQSGATVYRILNKQDMIIPVFSDNQETAKQWKGDAITENGSKAGLQNTPGNNSDDVSVLTSRYFPNQHFISIDKGEWLTPMETPEDVRDRKDPSKGLYRASMKGTFHEQGEDGQPAFFIDRQDVPHHKSSTYYRHTLGKHGFLVPALVQNVYANALNHTLQVEEQGTASPVPPVAEMVMPPEKLLYTLNVPGDNRGLWQHAQQLVDVDSDGPDNYRNRVARGTHTVHERFT